MSKKICILALVAMLLLATFGGCANNASTSSSDGPIKLGWVGSLTGDQAVLGTNESNMLKMLVEETNANGGILGRQIELICYDTKGDANEAVNATRRLASQDKVCAIIGPNASAHCIAMQSVLKEFKIPDISTVATNPKVTVDDATGEVHPYNFRVCFTDPYQGSIAGGYLYEVMGFSSAAILYDISDDFSQGLTEFFVKSFTGYGGTVVAQEAFKNGDTDFRAQLTKIKDTNPQAIFLPLFYKDVALIAKQARELGIECIFMGGDGWASDTLLEMAQEELQGSLLVNHLDTNDPDFLPLMEKYQEKYNETLALNGFMAHDAYLVFLAALEKAGSADSQAITDALTEVTVQGVTGTIKLSPEDHNPSGKEGCIQIIEGDTFMFVQKYGAQQ